MFTIVDDACARYEALSPRAPSLSIRREPTQGRVLVCVDQDVVFRLDTGYTPDDGWTVEASASAPPFVLPSRREEIREAYAAWAGESLADEGVATLLALPPGKYAMLRTAIAPSLSETLLLGNDVRPRPAGVDVLWNKRPLFAAHWLRAKAPAVALTCLAYGGSDSMTGLLFFEPFLASPEAATVASAMTERVLILPLSGALVLDVLSDVPRATALSRWQGEEVEQALELLGDQRRRRPA